MSRPRQFDEAALLDTAVDLFWTHGYAGTSIADVSRATSVGNGSIYAAYRSKDGLYAQVVTRYCRRLVETVRTALEGRGDDPATSLRAYLELIICDCTGEPARRGCLMLNSVGLLDQVPELHAVIDATTSELEAVLGDRLARDLRETGSASELATLAAEFVTLSQGLIQRSRLGRDPQELRDIADAAVRRLDRAGSLRR
jgi:AcrR family transcriptional regulator